MELTAFQFFPIVCGVVILMKIVHSITQKIQWQENHMNLSLSFFY